ncbi:MAG: type pilus assembly protein PilB [Patescibacteria group bacterium]|nr:type pilus assembly protein PilB [Patescibacteria group bacterium]
MILLDLFVSQNKLTDLEAKEIEADLHDHEGTVVDDLLKAKNITDDEILQVRSVLYGLPIYTGKITQDVSLTKFLNKQQSRQLLALPLSVEEKMLSVGIVDPEYAHVLDSLQFLFGPSHQAYKIYLISYDAYKEVLGIKGKQESLAQQVDEEGEQLNYVSKEGDIKKKGEEDEDMDLSSVNPDLDQELNKMQAPEIFSTMLRYAIDNGASDIHIEHVGTAVRARIRIDGVLDTATTLPAKHHSSLLARIKILSSMKLDEKRKPQDGRFSTKIGERAIDYRVSTFPGYYGEKVVIRILDSYRGVRDIKTIGLTEPNLNAIKEALGVSYGIILISGPTGSGKTTTLYSMLNEVDRDHQNVVSLEDPIEYNMPSMNQSQVFPEIGYTFASGLRSILRQDPDVIMVGEIRDVETAQLAIQAALTGHLVFSTIHTNTAIGVITRLLDMGIEPYLIAPTIKLAMGQRLARTIVEGSAKPMEMTTGLKQMIQNQFKDLPAEYKAKLPLDKPFHEAVASEKSPTGIKGRMPVFEVLTFTEEIQEAVTLRKSEDDIWKLARSQGYLTLKEDAMIKCIEGKVPFIELAGL